MLVNAVTRCYMPLDAAKCCLLMHLYSFLLLLLVPRRKQITPVPYCLTF